VADTLLLEVVTPKRLAVSCQADEVAVPGHDGEFGVLPGHTFLVSLLAIGRLSYCVGGRRESLVLGKGFAEVTADHVTVVTDSAKTLEEVDLAGAKERKARAEEWLRSGSAFDNDFGKIQEELKRANAEIEAKEERVGAS
jgi:F-type H+-transporting ATPase subunit epsilon